MKILYFVEFILYKGETRLFLHGKRMKKRSMNIRILFAVWLLLGSASCAGPDDAAPFGPAAGGRTEAIIGAYRLPDTRTSLDPDGRTTRWSAGDRIAVWARNAEFALDAQPFALHTFKGEYSAANFSATIPQMAEDTYTYYAVYPVPAQHSGTNVSFTLPSVQNGAYDGAADIMVAAPVMGPALAKTPREELTLAFRHLCHAVRIEIPAGRNRLGRPVKRLEIVFPAAVAGTLTFDAARPDAAPVLTDGTDTIVLDFPDEGLTDAEGTYAWIFIAPADIEGEITFHAFDGSGYQAAAIRTSVSKTFEAGHTTPIALTIPEARPLTRLDFQVAANNLGEELTQIRLAAAEELFVNPFSTKNATEASAARSADGIFRAEVYADAFPASALGGLPLTIDYESENALLRGYAIGLPAEIGAGNTVHVPMNVPFLFEEDFSGLNPSFEKNSEYTASDALNPDPIGLDEYGLAGWTGGRVGGKSGINLRICSRVEVGAWIPNRRPGRVDSAPINSIKPNRSVKIRVSYDYAGDRYNGTGGKSGDPVISFGYTTKQGNINIGDGLEHVLIDSRSIGIDGNDNNSQFYGNTPHNEQQEIADCTSETRLSWYITNNRGSSFAANGNYWLYLDNITVQIVK